MKKLLFTTIILVVNLLAHGESNDAGMKLLMKGDKKGALKIFQKECDIDKNGWACGNAAIMFERGLGVNKNTLKAKEYDKKGCDLNDVDSCRNLAEILLVEDKNSLSAKVYFQKVCRMKKYARNSLELKAVKDSCEKAKTIK